MTEKVKKKLPKYLQESKTLQGAKLGRGFEKKLVRQTIASGAICWDPGDISTSQYLVEVKSTTRKSYSLSYKTLKKIFNEAWRQGKEPIFILKIQDLKLVGRIELD